MSKIRTLWKKCLKPREENSQILKKKNENSPYTPAGVELFMVKGPLMMPEERSSSDPR